MKKECLICCDIKGCWKKCDQCHQSICFDCSLKIDFGCALCKKDLPKIFKDDDDVSEVGNYDNDSLDDDTASEISSDSDTSSDDDDDIIEKLTKENEALKKLNRFLSRERFRPYHLYFMRPFSY